MLPLKQTVEITKLLTLRGAFLLFSTRFASINLEVSENLFIVLHMIIGASIIVTK
jgi:hypothetical protein